LSKATLLNIIEYKYQIIYSVNRIGESFMIDLEYSLIIEATDEPDFFGFYSPDLEGFRGYCVNIEL
jgi:hypothetical protein